MGGDSSPAELPVIQHTAGLSKEERGMVAVHITAAMGTNAPPAAIIMAVDLARKNENIYSLLHNSPSSSAASSVYKLTAIEVAVAIGQNPLDSDAAVMEAIANHPNPEVGQILVRQLDQGFAKLPEQTQAKICESVLNNKTTALDSITRRVLESGSLPQSLQDRIRALPIPETISVGHEDYRYYTDT